MARNAGDGASRSGLSSVSRATAAMQTIVREVPVNFGPVVWLAPEQVDDTYFSLLPAKASEITIEEIAELSAVFGEGGEMQAERVS